MPLLALACSCMLVRAIEASCSWTQHDNSYSFGHAGDVSTNFDLAGAQDKCVELGNDVCKAVTCKVNWDCTVRKSEELGSSTISETSYVPLAACFETTTTAAPTTTSSQTTTAEALTTTTQAACPIADFSQTNIGGLQATAVVGQRDVSGNNWVFRWEQNRLKMVLADSDGVEIKHGYLNWAVSSTWEDSSTWVLGPWGWGRYEILNFQKNAVPCCERPNVIGYDLAACDPNLVQAGWNTSCGNCAAGYNGSVTHTMCALSGTAWSVSACWKATTEVSTTSAQGTNPPMTSILSTFASTNATTTTILAVVIEGSLAIEVDDPERFVADPEVVPVMKRAIAEMVGVNESWITDIRITLLSRRLAAKRRVQDMNIITESGVKVEFDITLPPDPTGTAQVTATILMEEFSQQSIEEATNVIQTALSSGVLTNGYNVEVSYKIMKIKEVATTSLAPAEDDDVQTMIIVIAVISCVFVLITLVMSVLIFRKKLRSRIMKGDLCMKESLRKDFERCMNLQTREGFRMEAGPLASAHLLEILHPADPVPEQQRQHLMQLIRAILDSNDTYDAEVFISYALDERPGDAQDCGRGLFHAAAVLKAFHDSGVRGFLTLPCDSFRGTVVDMLRTPGTACKTLAVLETAAFYASRQCLEEVHLAHLLNIPMVRLRLEEGLPAKSDWTIDPLEAENALMISMVGPVLDSLPTVPPRPQTILTEVSALEDLAKSSFVKSLLMQPDTNDSPTNRIPSTFGRSVYNVQNEESDTFFQLFNSSDSINDEDTSINWSEGGSPSEPAVLEVCDTKFLTRSDIARKGRFASAGSGGSSSCDPEDKSSIKRNRSPHPRDEKTTKVSHEKPERGARSRAVSDSGGDRKPKKAKEARSLGLKISSTKSAPHADPGENSMVMGCTRTEKSTGKFGNPRKIKKKSAS